MSPSRSGVGRTGARSRVSRFVVMAMLQAARARLLGLAEASAFSWGLNRSIFYAAAKKGFRAAAGSGRAAGTGEAEGTRELYTLGDEQAYRDLTNPTLYFTIGGETQTEKEFEHQIASRFGGPAQFRKAWKEALDIVGGEEKALLESGRGFYREVYRPRRDALAEKWTAEFLGTATG